MDPNLVEADWEIDSEAVRPLDGANERWLHCKKVDSSIKRCLRFGAHLAYV